MRKEISKEQTELIRHALGLGYSDISYRNYFTTYPECEDFKLWMDLVAKKYAYCNGSKPKIFGELVYFSVTDLGKNHINNIIKLEKEAHIKNTTRGQRRYQAYLESESCETFFEWITNTYWNNYRKERYC